MVCESSMMNLSSFSFFFLFIFISWRLITLQYCSGFCRTLTWISHGFTCVPHPDPRSHLFHKLTDFSQKWSWLSGGDESCGRDINNCNTVAILILERLRDPKNVIIPQGNDHLPWNWDCEDFCGCCCHWFSSVNSTTSMV